MNRLATAPLLSGLLIALAGPPSSGLSADVTAELSKDKSRVTVKIDGQLFAEYLTRSGTKPIVWPIIGPTGKPMTRGWPMTQAGPHEQKDHVHHRSLWFTHGDVNGVDFWSEQRKPAVIKHREFVEVAGGPEARIVTRNDWLDPNGKKVCEDERTLAFGADGDARWIDFDIVLSATAGRVTLGDTKEGTFGIRMAATMKPDAKLGGRVVNSEGNAGADVWGKRASWVDYFGPVDGETVGIALMNHPKSFRYPTHWHARTYGLCSANPFGASCFEGPGADGSATIEAGESLRLYYRVYLHKGDDEQGRVSAAFEAYCKRAKK
ncbi:MAG: PmoA family protein [Pirellulales bacterium]|nr:PmoA family protein [Pirellulales bacterium]